MSPGKVAAAGLMLLGLGACRPVPVQEPWIGGPGEQVKQSWLNPSSPQQRDRLRTRLIASQADR